ncbi:hypothetical protein HS125_11885 [bacterium]|nr:hypothetical protein [bacterium]
MLDGCFLTKKWNGRDIVFDSVNYRCQWDDSSAKWFYALDLWGDHETSERLLDTVFARQGQRKPAGARTREGCFSDVTNLERDGSAASWASGNGWALWAMAQHARLSGDRDWLARHKEAILAGCDWIIRERGFSRETPDNPCAGLLYGKFVCDLPDQGQVCGVGYFTYTDAISYLGLHQMGQLLTDWGHAEGARILTEAEAYRKDILAAVDKLTDKTRDPWFIPWMLHAPRHEDRYFYDVCGPINLAFAGVVPRTDERIAHVIRWIVEHEHGGSLEEAAAGRRHAPEGAMFYSQDLAVVLLQQGRVQDFQRIFYTLLSANVSHDTLTTCEWRRNTQPHIHSIASLMRMFRTMLVDERDGGLYLLSGVPLSWTNMGQVIEFRELPTRYGPVSLLCSSQLYMRLVVVRGGPQLAGLPLSVRIPLPEGYRISRAYSRPAQILEIEGEWVRWEGHAGDITFHIEIDRASAPR